MEEPSPSRLKISSNTHDDVFWAAALALYSTVEMVEEPEVLVVPR